MIPAHALPLLSLFLWLGPAPKRDLMSKSNPKKRPPLEASPPKPFLSYASDDSSINPKAGVSNMCKVVHRDDVDSLVGCPMEGLGHLLLSRLPDCYGNPFVFPSLFFYLRFGDATSNICISFYRLLLFILAMVKRYNKMRANFEAALS
ncbi:hypothetical protein Salat_2043100 [Sesamum alatum]|uniref:Uncharacterized protein n=1 Tax=Sesamum alatum TaxID=300844 RepID=A0AAE1XZE5_9LAMI|nr:hypothetical protein Salat_2043100 [Sesamum alatum]